MRIKRKNDIKMILKKGTDKTKNDNKMKTKTVIFREMRKMIMKMIMKW